MTDRIYRRDGYGSEFQATVLTVEGDDVILDSTAFYPGGGGQVCDLGTVRGLAVTDVHENKDGDIVHVIPGNDLHPGEKVWCSVDWERRYDLMQGHTGEHLLFCSLKRQCPDLAITKIYISPESKYVIVNHDLEWDRIEAAVHFANQAIADNLPVTHTTMDRDDPELVEKVRIKLDRIPENEEITVVAIGDIDYSACSGVHVMETSELELLLVDRKVSAGAEGVAIHFKIGRAAKEAAISLATVALSITDAMGCKLEDAPRAVSNLRTEDAAKTRMLKSAARRLAGSVAPESIGGIPIYVASLPGSDRNALNDLAEKARSEGGVALIVGQGDTLSVMMSSGDPRIDCRALLPAVLKRFGGRGGGKPEFAQGGVPDPELEGEVLDAMKKAVSDELNGSGERCGRTQP